MTLRENANEWIKEILFQLVLEAPENRLADFSEQPIFDSPLIGIIDGDDEIFPRFRKIVSPAHILPREILENQSSPGTDLSTVRVVSWVLPFSAEVRRSNRRREWPSPMYSLARNNGGALNWLLSRRIQSRLRKKGYAAVSPTLTKEYDAFRCGERTFSSSWSERHVAYAAGLGSFGLSGCLITPRGAMVRLGSLVTNMPLRVTAVRKKDHRAPCLGNNGDGCGRCIGRCPVGAISNEGLDKSKCYNRRQAIREGFLERYLEEFHLLSAPIVKSGWQEMGFSLGCALCATGVPCEMEEVPPGLKR